MTQEKTRPNPFWMLLQGDELVGRKALLQEWQRHLEHAPATRIQWLVAPRGVGKSRGLKKLADMATHAGWTVVYTRVHQGDSEKTMVTKVHAVLPAAAAKNLAAQVTQISYDARKRHAQGVLWILDDLDRMPGANRLLKKGQRVIRNAPVSWWVLASATALAKRTGVEILGMPLPTIPELEQLLTQTLEKEKIRWGRECMRAMEEESGRNPYVLLTMAHVLYARLPGNEKRITRAQYIRNVPVVLEALGDVLDELYYQTSPLEQRILKAVADGRAHSVTQIARKIRRPLNTVTTLAKRLVRKGSLVRVERGYYRLWVPIYGKYILRR